MCAWCKVFINNKPPFGDTAITHGMCPKCDKQVNEEMDRMGYPPYKEPLK